MLQVGLSAVAVDLEAWDDRDGDVDVEVVEVVSRSRLMRRERTYCAPEPWPKYRRMEEDEVGEDGSVQEGGVSAVQNSASLGARSMMLDHDVRVDNGFSNRACVFAKSREGLRIYVPVLHGM